jgi:hypothetical protein
VSIQPAWQQEFDFLGLPIVVEPAMEQLSSDAGLLPLRQFDERIGLTGQVAAALDDPRQPQRIRHELLEMTRARIYGILADYEDQNDHDTLRCDPVFKLVAGRSPDAPDLASQPTLSRFENHVSIPALKRLKALLLDQFIASFAAPPRQLTIDLDAVDDPAHGQQQLVLFHGFYGQHQYFPLVITSADTDQALMLRLRPGAVHAALMADEDLAFLVTRLRQAWPTVQLHIRGDAGFGVPRMYAVCERLGLDFTFGLSANKVLQARSDALLAQAVAQFETTGTPQRLFDGFWYQAASWPHPRWVIVKAEAQAQGTNRRFIVTNRPGAFVLPEATYDDYVLRGESENRNKELKTDLHVDRLSDHRFMANQFRLYLHASALNLLVRLRREIADPPPPEPNAAVPTEALTGAARQRYQRRRRQCDPLGEGQPCTWRMLLIKVAASVVVSTRRILVRLSASWPHLDHFRRVSAHVQARPKVAYHWTG